MPLSKLKDGFLDGTSSTYLEDLEERYRSNPSSVDKSWSSFFRSLGESLCKTILCSLLANTHSLEFALNALGNGGTRAAASFLAHHIPALVSDALQSQESLQKPWLRPSTILSKEAAKWSPCQLLLCPTRASKKACDCCSLSELIRYICTL